jgi:hypothetical protein
VIKNRNVLLVLKKLCNMLKRMVKCLLFELIIGIGFMETSALDSTNVEKAFMGIIKEIYHLTLSDHWN